MGRRGSDVGPGGASLAAVEERLDASWNHLMHLSLSESTHRTYASGINKFINFCGTFSYVICPAEEATLLKFISFMHIIESLALSTIQTYLSAVRFLHLSLGFQNPFPDFPRIMLVMKGLKKSSVPIRKRLPITPKLLMAIRPLLILSKYDETACFGFL